MSVTVQMLCDSIKTNQLTDIELSGSQITDEDVDYIATSLEGNRTLTTMDFTASSISAEGFKTILKTLNVFTILHELYLSYNSIGAEDKSFEDYLELFKLISETFLITLDLSYNNISQIGVEALIKALPSITITTFYLENYIYNLDYILHLGLLILIVLYLHLENLFVGLGI